MPNYTVSQLVSKYNNKNDMTSRAICVVCSTLSYNNARYISFPSRNPVDILKTLLALTNWTMVLVGNIPSNTDKMVIWKNVLEIVVDVELGSSSPIVDDVCVTSDGILLRLKANPTWDRCRKSVKKYPSRIRKAATSLVSIFDEYDSWGSVTLNPITA